MKEYFKATIFKYVENDNYENGTYGKTQDFGPVDTFKSEFIISLISQLIGQFGQDFIKNVENFETQINYSRLENNEGIEPYQSELKDFRAGEIDLYLASYTIHIERIIVSDFTEFEVETVINIIKKGGKNEKFN